jgi:NADH dehydrogenase/NADH:ubiquinone oxidoreductase subunit G
MVELRDGDRSKLVASCIYPVADGIHIHTDSKRVQNVRRWILEMLLSDCPNSDVIRGLAARYGVLSTRFPLRQEENSCMVCGLCQRVCEEVVGLSAIAVVDRGVHKRVGAPFMRPTDVCVACGSCVSVCPTGAMQNLFESVRKTSAIPLTQMS